MPRPWHEALAGARLSGTDHPCALAAQTLTAARHWRNTPTSPVCAALHCNARVLQLIPHIP